MTSPDGDDDRAFDSYPLSLPLFSRDDFALRFTRPVTIIVGENGSGKSTLLEAIAKLAGFSVMGGSRNHINYDREDVELAQHLRLSWLPKVGNGFFLRAETMFNFASTIDELAHEPGGSYDAYGGKSLKQRSHGEGFLALFENRFSSRGLYILDEPEAALSPQRQIEFLRAIKRMERSENCQIIIATHSVLVAAYPDAQLLNVQDGRLVETGLHKLTHFKTLYNFFYNPDAFIEDALSEEQDDEDCDAQDDFDDA